ncbi:MAG: Ig-like domain-containing protein [bacterium]
MQSRPDRANKVMQWMRGWEWWPLFLAIALALGWTGYAAAAGLSQEATQTALKVETSNVGPRTKVTLTAHVAPLNGSEALGGVVNFRASGLNLDLGSAAVDSAGNAVLTTNSLPPGNLQVLAAYSGDAAHGASLSPSQQVEAEASSAAGFGVSAAPTSLTTPAGGFVTSVITVTPENGFNSQLSTYVTLSCSELPFGTTCTFSPSNVLAGCTPMCTPVTSTLQIQTLGTQPVSGSPVSRLGSRQAPGTKLPAYAFLFPAFFGLVGLGARRRKAWRNAGLILLVFAGAMSLTACNPRYYYLVHGPIPNTGTPTGSYSITVNAAASSGSLLVTPSTSPQLALTVTASTQSSTLGAEQSSTLGAAQ